MTLVVGTNTYINLADADIYFNNRFGSATWLGMTDALKEQALVSATRLLDNYSDWIGEKTEEDQALQFPRNGDLSVPGNIIYAQCEIAISIADNGGIISNPEPVLKKMKADVVEFEWNEKNTSVNYTLFSSHTLDLLRNYMAGKSLVRV